MSNEFFINTYIETLKQHAAYLNSKELQVKKKMTARYKIFETCHKLLRVILLRKLLAAANDISTVYLP